MAGTTVGEQRSKGITVGIADAIIEKLKRHRFLINMAHTGNPYENAMTESFFKTLEHEEVDLCESMRPVRTWYAGLPIFLKRPTIKTGLTQRLIAARQTNLRSTA